MSKIGLLVALLALGCGSSEGGAAFDESEPLGSGGSGVAGASGALAGSSGSSAGGQQGEAGAGAGAPAGGLGGEPVKGGESAGGAAGSAAGGGAGGGDTAGQSGGGSGQAGGGGATAGTGGAGQAGTAAGQGGSGGLGPVPPDGYSECSGDDVLDCNGVPGDGLNQITPDSCEAWKGDHGTCGSCTKKCGLSQICKMFGSPGAWSYGCVSP